MKNLKCRAWTEERGYIYEPYDGAENASWVLAWCQANDIEPMVCPDLHDINGVAIYEHSLVMLPRWDEENPFTVFIESGNTVLRHENITYQSDMFEPADLRVVGSTKEGITGGNDGK